MKSKPEKIFWRLNWLTTFAIVAVGLVLIALAIINANKVDLQEAADERVLPVLTRIVDGNFPDTAQNIDDVIDAAFAPVYANIAGFTDWHYSVMGQYSELGAAAFGNLDQQIEQRLLAGLDARLAGALTDIDADLMREFETLLADILDEESRAMPANQQAEFRLALESAFEDTRTRFGQSVAFSGAASLVGASGGVIAANLFIRAISRKLLASVATKFAARTAVKASGIGAGAGAGASVGALGGPIGAGIGGVVGAVAGWLFIDAVVINVDEWLNREEYEAELQQTIDAQKQAVKTQIRVTIDATIDAMALSVEGKSPSELN